MSGGKKGVLEGAAKAIVDRQRDDESHDASGHAENGNDRDQGNYGLTALGAQIAVRDKGLKITGRMQIPHREPDRRI